MNARSTARAAAPDLADRIVDAAIELAEERGWDQVRLYLVAERLGIGLGEIGRQFRDLDAIANAWFGRARNALLRTPPAALEGRPPERLHAAVTAWLDALAAHRTVTLQMLDAKLYPSHPHHWVPMIFDLSRLMHDFLDVARIASTGRRRQLAEVGMTAIFLATLRDWRGDPELAAERLQQRLRGADRWLARLEKGWIPRPTRVGEAGGRG
jgi:AcrR family transcriptional regulator